MTTKLSDGTLQSASGNILYSVLNSPIYAKGFLERFYADSVAGAITTSDIFPAELKNCGDQVMFRRPPVGEIFDYQRGQELDHSHLSTEIVTMVIKRGKYWNLQLDYVDQKQICNIMDYVNEFKNNSAIMLRQIIDREILTEVPLKADPFNKGIRAGKRTGAYNLGQLGAPVSLNSGNLIRYLTYLGAVLDEQNLPQSGRYVVLPSIARTLFANNALLNNANQSGLNKAIVISMDFIDLAGFKIYFSNDMPQYRDPTGQITYMILAGYKNATGFITQLTRQEVIDKDPRSFSTYWRALNIYDFDVLMPEKLAVLYSTIDIR